MELAKNACLRGSSAIGAAIRRFAVELGHDLAELGIAAGVVADPPGDPGKGFASPAVNPRPVAADCLLASPGGEDPSDRPVDVTVALLQVVHTMSAYSQPSLTEAVSKTPSRSAR